MCDICGVGAASRCCTAGSADSVTGPGAGAGGAGAGRGDATGGGIGEAGTEMDEGEGEGERTAACAGPCDSLCRRRVTGEVNVGAPPPLDVATRAASAAIGAVLVASGAGASSAADGVGAAERSFSASTARAAASCCACGLLRGMMNFLRPCVGAVGPGFQALLGYSVDGNSAAVISAAGFFCSASYSALRRLPMVPSTTYVPLLGAVATSSADFRMATPRFLM